MRTTLLKTEEAQHGWFIVDAAGQRLGTLAVFRENTNPAGRRTSTTAISSW
jgi:ribosomal protein L13